MAWKKYSQMSAEEKKASWGKFRDSQSKKMEMAKKMRNASKPQHPSDHKEEPNPGGYCRHCGFGSDHS